MATRVDLQQLTVDRSASAPTAFVRKRSWLIRWGLPSAIIAGFVGIASWSARDYWLPAQSVTVLPVVLTKADMQHAGTPLFQAAGWIEPRPTAVICSALAEGVLEELLVVEGQEVVADQPVARLVDAEARLSLREAEAMLELREAERDAAQAVLTAAQRHLEQPVHLMAAHAEAEAALATLESEMKNLPFSIESAEARLTLARQDLEGKQAVADSIAGRSIQRAQSEFDSANAALEELKQRGPQLARQQAAWRRRVDAIGTTLDLKTDEHRAFDEATANLAAADARVSQARLAIETAELRLKRMTVRSPIHGRVLSLHAQPGQRLMGINAASERDASTVVTLYDPQKLQVRVDVRLEDVQQVEVGQAVQISTAATSETLAGEVLAITSQADIQKNTLQVKVSILGPSAIIRPDMLAQVTFLAPHRTDGQSDGEQGTLRLLVPLALVDFSEEAATVWVADPSREVADRRTIQLGRAGNEQLVEVAEGLSALDKLIVSGRENLSDGARIRITGVDRSLGATPIESTAASTTVSTTLRAPTP